MMGSSANLQVKAMAMRSDCTRRDSAKSERRDYLRKNSTFSTATILLRVVIARVASGVACGLGGHALPHEVACVLMGSRVASGGQE
jgi:hypothetical protein